MDTDKEITVARDGSCNSGRNTKATTIADRKKSRNWCFTLNNYEQKDIDSLLSKKSEFGFVFQQEEGKEGTPHLQGLIELKMAVAFSWVKKLIPRAHWEICRNKLAARQYCAKEDTRTGEVYSNLQDFSPNKNSNGSAQMARPTFKKLFVENWIDMETLVTKKIIASIEEGIVILKYLDDREDITDLLNLDESVTRTFRVVWNKHKQWFDLETDKGHRG